MSETKATPDENATAATNDDTNHKFFVFFSGEQAYAVEPTSVVEVISKFVPTPVPFTPGWIPGVINTRGSIVPILDLNSLFEFGEPLARQHFERLIIIDTGDHTVAFGSKGIRGIESVSEKDLEPTVMNLPELLQKCSRVHFRLGNQLVYALDLGSLIEQSRLRIRQG